MKSISVARAVGVMLLALPLIAGCMLTRNPAPLSILAPSVKTEARAAEQAVNWSLQVQRPVADAMRDSDRVLVRRAQSRLQVYAGAAWLDSVPEMLQALMIQSFSDTGSFTGVSRAGGMRTRFSLASELRHFEVVDDGGPDLTVEIALQASLIHQRTARPVASQTFAQQRRIDGKGLDAVVAGFEQALDSLMEELIDWVFEQSASAAARMERETDPRGRWQRQDSDG